MQAQIRLMHPRRLARLLLCAPVRLDLRRRHLPRSLLLGRRLRPRRRLGRVLVRLLDDRALRRRRSVGGCGGR